MEKVQGTDASRAAPGVVTAKRTWPATTQSRAPTHDFALNPLHSHHKALAFARLSKSTNGKTPDTFNSENIDASYPLYIPSPLFPKPNTAESPVAREKLEAQIKSADMTEDMQQESIEVAQEAMAKFTIEKDIAQHIKRTFDERKGPTWHCIVGRNFGSFVTHETKHFIYFYLGHCAILLFKTQ
ncbi:hypothetical protein FVER53590_00649 [Fusarium verticillioides]|nr:hypothetical protein FVER53590_00649 [Fusarium verticillioides]